MRLVLDATSGSLLPQVSHKPPCLLRLLDKPFLFHLIERCVEAGIRTFTIVLSHRPELIETALEEGKRWGVQIDYALAREPSAFFQRLKPTAAAWSSSRVLLAQADTLPLGDLQELFPIDDEGSPLFFTSPDGHWTGWANIPTRLLQTLPSDLPLSALSAHLRTASQRILPHKLLSIRSFDDWHRSNLFLLQSGQTPFSPTSSRQIEQGIWLSRATLLHPSAEIIPPVFIGENCQIFANTQIGPNAIIENGCLIDTHSVIADSLICQHTYVGETLALHQCIVDRHLLVNLALNTHIVLEDERLVGQIDPPAIGEQSFFLLERLFATALLMIFSPLLALLLWQGRLTAEQMVRLPAPEDPTLWQTCPLPRLRGSQSGILPALIAIVRGDLHFVGVTPLPPSQLLLLPPDWRKLYLRSKVGCINLADVYTETGDRSHHDAYYAVHNSWLFDLQLCFRYLYNCFFRWRK